LILLAISKLEALLRLRHNIQTSLLGSYMRKSAWSTGIVNIGKRVAVNFRFLNTDIHSEIRLEKETATKATEEY